MSDQYLRLLRSLLKTLDALKASLDQYENTKRQHQQTAHNQNEQPPPIEIRSELSLPVPVREYYEAEQRERQSAWRKIKAGLEIVGVTVAVILACLTYYTLQKVSSQSDSAQKQVRIMQKQLEVTDRPWIKTVSVRPLRGLEFMDGDRDGGSLHIGMRMKIKNVGHSVALDVALRDKAMFSQDTTQVLKEQKRMCSDPPMTDSWTFNLFPGEDSGDKLLTDHFERLPTDVYSGLIVVPKEVKGVEGEKFVSPRIVGCVTYRIASSGVIHHTGFIYNVGIFEASEAPILKLLKIGNDIPMKQWTLSEDVLGFDAN